MSKSTFLLAAAAVFGSTQILHHGNAAMVVNCNDSSGPICIDSRFGNPSLDLAFDGTQFICGVNAENPQSVRCPIGTCCSKWGYCGPDLGPNNPYPHMSPEANENLYCNADSSGDWRVVSCDSKFAVEVKCDDLSATDPSGDSAAHWFTIAPEVREGKCIDKRYGDPTLSVKRAPDGDLCGIRARAKGTPSRCPFGMCCSKHGYCGPHRAPDGSPVPKEFEAFYCDANAGDWRYISCASEHAVFLDGTSPHPVEPKVEEEEKCIDMRYGNPTLSVHSDPEGDLCGIRARAKGTLARCPFGMCCSKQGYCGPHRAPDGSPVPKEFEAFYCDANAGDWRYISCASEHAVFLDGTLAH